MSVGKGHDDSPSPGRWSACMGEKLRHLGIVGPLYVIVVVVSVVCYWEYAQLHRECVELRETAKTHERLLESLSEEVMRLNSGRRRTTIDKDVVLAKHQVDDVKTQSHERLLYREKRSRRRRNKRRHKKRKGGQYKNLGTDRRKTMCRWCKRMERDIKAIIGKNPNCSVTVKNTLYPASSGSLPSIHLRGYQSKNSKSNTFKGPNERFKWSHPTTNIFYKYFTYNEIDSSLTVAQVGLYLVYSQVLLDGRDFTNQSKRISYSGYKTVQIEADNVRGERDVKLPLMRSVATQHRRGLMYNGNFPKDTLSHIGVFPLKANDKLVVVTDEYSIKGDRFMNSKDWNYFGVIKLD